MVTMSSRPSPTSLAIRLLDSKEQGMSFLAVGLSTVIAAHGL